MPLKAGAVRTTCPYCGVGCGVLATPKPDGTIAIAGDPEHPANFGRLCSKGAALGETLSLDDRLLHPLINGNRVTWDAALDRVASGFMQTIADYGPDSVAFYVSGQLLTEDYYVANKLMKGFIGSANIDTNSRLCMASSVAGHKRAFGSDTVPGVYEDLELADLVVLVGSNLAWCHPVLHQRLMAARETRGTRIVVIDPRATATTEGVDLHLKLAPGSDVALFDGLLRHLAVSGVINTGYIAAHTSGFDDASAEAASFDVSKVAHLTGLSPLDVAAFYDLFATFEKSVTVYSQGVNQSSAGTDKVNAIINCHLATGRIGRPGMGPFSVTGQPNAMGGREVGGMANMLAAHMELGNAQHTSLVQNFWRSPRIATRPGLKAVDMFRAVADGRVKAIWIMGTNPVDSMPEADGVRAALKACPLVVVSDVVRHTDTTALAHVLLPALAWGEKDGTVTNSERRISRQRAFLPPPGEARADWWQLAQVARRMGFADAFAYTGPADIYAEHATLSGLDNHGTRDFDIGSHSRITSSRYAAMEPFQWPRPQQSIAATTRFFGQGGYFTPDARARFVPTPYRPMATKTTTKFPLTLNTGRIRDQWHTMTRTAKTPRLMSHIAEPFLEVHPDDASQLGLVEASLATVRSPHGSAILRVLITSRQRPGSVFAPMHWTDQLASSARVDALIGAETDPVSGQPELKAMAVRVERFAATWYGFAVSRERPDQIDTEYWAVAPATGGWRTELAGRIAPGSWDDLCRTLLGLDATAGHEMLAYHDVASGQHRYAAFDGPQLVGALYLAPGPVAVARAHAADSLRATYAEPRDRLRLLAGRPGATERDRGAIVCACFDVGLNQIADAVTKGGCLSVAAVGKSLSAGTNCGSCRPEIGRIVQANAH